MKKLLIAVLSCLLVLSALTGCNRKENNITSPSGAVSETQGDNSGNAGTRSELILAKDGNTEHSIVYPLNSGSEIMAAVSELTTAFKNMYGVRILCRNDTASAESADAREILVGATNRSASRKVLEGLEKDTYQACISGNQLVLVGDSDTGTARAVKEWIAVAFSAQGSVLTFSEENGFSGQAEKILRFSIFGDSISTYDGYSNAASYNSVMAGNPVYYKATPGSTYIPVEDTWWQRVVTGMHGTLCVNNSYSGGRVTQNHTPIHAANLHNMAGETPDVILIYYGINDYNNAVPKYLFTEAYDQMLKIMKQTYPDAKIYCCTLNAIQDARGTSLEQNNAGTTLVQYNKIITDTAAKNGVEVIDLYSQIGLELYKHTFDHIHPNSEGMKMMSDIISARLHDDFDQAE